MCGEKLITAQVRANQRGSPPRVRGKVLRSGSSTPAPWITPACAGKSGLEVGLTKTRKDHPRVCGEKVMSNMTYTAREGSPPRVRGKARRKSRRQSGDRITPACAGKRLKKAHKIKDFDPVPIRFHLVFRRFERWCSNLPTPDGNVPV